MGMTLKDKVENYFEAELLKHLHGPLLAGTMVADADSAGYFSRLPQRYPDDARCMV